MSAYLKEATFFVIKLSLHLLSRYLSYIVTMTSVEIINIINFDIEIAKKNK